ncbi:MAG: DUF4390 domain-containing protein [Gammaproteobacteria bacterium]|nr:DUF4390 domain-containing protein [Gammaproteobacteria bacterium]
MKRSVRRFIVISLTIFAILVGWLLIQLSNLKHGVDIHSADLRYISGNAILNADIKFHFSETALQSLKNGIALPVEIDVVLKSQRDLVWDKTEWHTVLEYQIRYQALARSYELINQISGSSRSFASRKAVVDALGRIRGMPVANTECSQPIQHCYLKIKASLNREGLPLPLRPTAYLTLDWYVSSRWRQWPLTS